MNQKKYVAYEDIEKFSPVFAFYCPKTNKNYVYISHELTEIDSGIPYCVGVCNNTVKRGELAQIITTGPTKIRYFGGNPDNKTDVYIVKTFKNFHMKGICSSLGLNMVPFINNDNSMIKIGTVSQNFSDKKDQEIKLKYLNINIQIATESIATEVEKEPEKIVLGLPEKTFTFIDIGKDLDASIKSEVVQEKFNNLCNSLSSNPGPKEYCLLIDQYCRIVFQNIPDPILKGFTKKLSVFNTSGQALYDSHGQISIYNYRLNDIYRITLIPNILRVNNFPVYDSFKYSAYFPYINIDDSNNQNFIESIFSYSSSCFKEISNAYHNGIGTNTRYSLIDQSFEHNIAYLMPITKNNNNDSDSLIFRLTWKKI